MMETFINTLGFFPRGLVYVVLGLVILLIAKIAKDLITSYKIDEQVVQKNNTAIALTLSGYFAAVIFIFVGAVYQPLTNARIDGLALFNRGFGLDVLQVALYSLAGIVALNLARIFMDHLVLYKFSIDEELVEGQNLGTAAAQVGMILAIGLLIGGAVSGAGGGPLTALAFFGMGMVVLVLFALFYELTTPFNIHDEILKDNVAVGVALGGNLVAIGLVTLKAVFGEFSGWTQGIIEFVIFAVVGFVLLYVLRLLIDLLILPTTKVSAAIANEQNVGVAFVESTVVIGAALILFFAI